MLIPQQTARVSSTIVESSRGEPFAAVGALKSGSPLRTRVGIATGLVVVGDLIGSGGAQEQAIVGDTPNLAARLQGLAEPNMVVIADLSDPSFMDNDCAFWMGTNRPKFRGIDEKTPDPERLILFHGQSVVLCNR